MPPSCTSANRLLISTGMNSKYLAGAFVSGILLLAVLIVFLFFTTTVDTGNVGVITNFGRITAEVAPPTSILGAFVPGTAASPRFVEIKGVIRF